jgi:hypothetical protein
VRRWRDDLDAENLRADHAADGDRGDDRLDAARSEENGVGPRRAAPLRGATAGEPQHLTWSPVHTGPPGPHAGRRNADRFTRIDDLFVRADNGGTGLLGDKAVLTSIPITAGKDPLIPRASSRR